MFFGGENKLLPPRWLCLPGTEPLKSTFQTFWQPNDSGGRPMTRSCFNLSEGFSPWDARIIWEPKCDAIRGLRNSRNTNPRLNIFAFHVVPHHFQIWYMLSNGINQKYVGRFTRAHPKSHFTNYFECVEVFGLQLFNDRTNTLDTTILKHQPQELAGEAKVGDFTENSTAVYKCRKIISWKGWSISRNSITLSIGRYAWKVIWWSYSRDWNLSRTFRQYSTTLQAFVCSAYLREQKYDKTRSWNISRRIC
jgi:hypothetical protein